MTGEGWLPPQPELEEAVARLRGQLSITRAKPNYVMEGVEWQYSVTVELASGGFLSEPDATVLTESSQRLEDAVGYMLARLDAMGGSGPVAGQLGFDGEEVGR